MAPKRARIRSAARGVTLRRPARAPGPRADPGGVPAAAVDLVDLKLGRLQGLGFIRLQDASYFGKAVQVCGMVSGVHVDNGEAFLRLKVTGTQDDNLLPSLTGKPDRMIDVRIRASTCPGTLTGEFLVHGRKFEEVAKEAEPWYTNMESVVDVEAGQDELARLRAAARIPGGVGPLEPLREEVIPKEKKKRKKEERKDKKKEDAKKERKASEEQDEDEPLGKEGVGGALCRDWPRPESASEEETPEEGETPSEGQEEEEKEKRRWK